MCENKMKYQLVGNSDRFIVQTLQNTVMKMTKDL